MTKTITKAAPIANDVAIKIVDKKFVFGAEGSKRRQSWNALKGIKGKATVGKYLERGGARKYVARWANAGVIAFA